MKHTIFGINIRHVSLNIVTKRPEKGHCVFEKTTILTAVPTVFIPIATQTLLSLIQTTYTNSRNVTQHKSSFSFSTHKQLFTVQSRDTVTSRNQLTRDTWSITLLKARRSALVPLTAQTDRRHRSTTHCAQPTQFAVILSFCHFPSVFIEEHTVGVPEMELDQRFQNPY